MSASAVPAFKAALLNALNSRPSLESVAILWDIEDDPNSAGTSAIGVLEDSFEQSPVGAAGSRGATRDERLTVRLGVRHHVYDTARASEEGIWRIVDEVEATISADRSLSGVYNAFLTSGRRTGSQPTPDAWEQRIELTVTARARLRPA